MTLKPAHLQWSDDGTLRSIDFDDIYFQPKQGPAESHYVFLEKNNLPQRFISPAEDSFRIAELGFGTGLNFLLTAQLWHKTAPAAARLSYISIEKHPIPSSDLKRIFAFWPALQEYTQPLLDQYPPLLEGFHHLHFFNKRIHLILLFGDVAETLPELSGRMDAWYLDGFSPAKNPDMWSEKLFPLIAAHTSPGGTLATFSAAGAVRRGLQASGFSVEKIDGFGTKRDMTVATMPDPPPALHRPKRKTAVVLGAGIAGASAAFALAQKGYAVTVIDRAPQVAAETSGNPIGIVYPKLVIDNSPFGSFHRHGFNFTRNLVTALRLPSWTPCGVIHLDVTDEEKNRHQTLGRQGYPEDFLRYQMTDRGHGLYQPSAGFLSPPEFCRALLDHPDITLRYSTTITALEELEGETVVIALNYDAKNFHQTAWLPLQCLRGQLTYLRPTPQSEKLPHVYCHDGFITPLINGIHYTGATFQREEPSGMELRDSDHQENLLKLEQNIPGLNFTPEDIIGGRAGYRTTTPDKLPLIGACPDYPAFMESFAGLRNGKKEQYERKYVEKTFISAAFGAYGMTGAPLAGEMIACLISGDPLPLPASLMDYLAPERFIIRDLKRGKI